MGKFKKADLYNRILSVYKSSGQGVMTELLLDNKKEMEQLISEDLIKIITIPFGHLSNQIYYCITSAYCTEEVMVDNFIVLTYIRSYLGIEEEEIQGFKWERDEKYYKWYEENQDKLKLIKDLPRYEELNIVQNDDDSDQDIIEFLRNHKRYKKNSAISNVIRDFKEICFLNEQMIILSKQYLIKKPGTEEYESKINESTKEIEIYEKTISFLSDFDKSKRLQEII